MFEFCSREGVCDSSNAGKSNTGQFKMAALIWGHIFCLRFLALCYIYFRLSRSILNGCIDVGSYFLSQVLSSVLHLF